MGLQAQSDRDDDLEDIPRIGGLLKANATLATAFYAAGTHDSFLGEFRLTVHGGLGEREDDGVRRYGRRARFELAQVPR